MFPAKTKSPLAVAEKAAQAYSDSQPVGATTMPCPNAKQELKEVIKVKVVGEDGVGLGGVALLLSREDKQVLTGKTAPDGVYAFKGLDAGSYQLSLPELDKDAWEVLESKALVGDEGKSSRVASWGSAAAEITEEEKIHVIQQGECVGKIAEVYGFFPRTIWDYPKNKELKRLRHDNMYILFPGDKVVVPGKRRKTQVVKARDGLTVQRRGVPERLRIRFLHYDETPRVGVPYLLSVKTAEGILVADILGVTDGGGFVDQAIPPSAKFATITLNPGIWPEVHEFNLGYINPIDSISGWQARLNNLGYACGQVNGVINEQSTAAICAFQKAKNLEITGILDPKSKALITNISLS